MKKFRAIYKGFNNREMIGKTYDSFAVCKRFAKKENLIRFEEIETTYIFNEDMKPIRKNVRISEVK